MGGEELFRLRSADQGRSLKPDTHLYRREPVDSVEDTDAYPANEQRPWESMSKQTHTAADHRSKLVSVKALSSQSVSNYIKFNSGK